MNKETKIAEENIKRINTLSLFIDSYTYGVGKDKKKEREFREDMGMTRSESETHKSSCERFLEFLKEHVKGLEFVYQKIKGLGEFNQWQDMEKKITDLKQAIKLYEDAGI